MSNTRGHALPRAGALPPPAAHHRSERPSPAAHYRSERPSPAAHYRSERVPADAFRSRDSPHDLDARALQKLREEAATKIQAAARGQLDRMKVKAKRRTFFTLENNHPNFRRVNTRANLGMGHAADCLELAADYEDTKIQSDRKIRLLDDSRSATHLSVMHKWAAWSRTQRIFTNPSVFLNLGIMGAVASLTRSGELTPAYGDAALTGASLLLNFLIVFYFGYGYARLQDQYESAMKLRGCIFDVCFLSRGIFKDDATVMRLWRYMNLFHTLGYTGLTPVYDETNFYGPFCREWELLPDDCPEEAARLEEIGVTTGIAAWHEVIQWCIQLIDDEFEQGRITPSKQRFMQGHILEARAAMGHLFHAHFQVLPITYLHVVATTVYAYLALASAVKGTLFTPDSDRLFGLIVPACTTVLLNFTTIGLLQLGTAFSNPVGTEDSDLAAYHFMTDAAKESKRICESTRLKKAPRRDPQVAARLRAQSAEAKADSPKAPSPGHAATSGLSNRVRMPAARYGDQAVKA